MPKKKEVRRGASPRPDMYTKKRSGLIAQSIRVTVQENRLFRKAAGRLSFNQWASEILIAAAKEQIAAAQAVPEPNSESETSIA